MMRIVLVTKIMFFIRSEGNEWAFSSFFVGISTNVCYNVWVGSD